VKTKPQEMFIAVRPDGTMCGPCMDDYEMVKASLDIGLNRVRKRSGKMGGPIFAEGQSWEEMGYRIIKCLVTPLTILIVCLALSTPCLACGHGHGGHGHGYGHHGGQCGKPSGPSVTPSVTPAAVTTGPSAPAPSAPAAPSVAPAPAPAQAPSAPAGPATPGSGSQGKGYGHGCWEEGCGR
jgi:hypothetical protein